MKNLKKVSHWRNAIAAGAVAGAMLLFAAATPRAYADDREKCEHRIDKAEHRLDDAVREHGERSRQADDRRRDLNAERERCWNEYHGWWDGRTHQWHQHRDWDDEHDRDHDRDRDDHH